MMIGMGEKILNMDSEIQPQISSRSSGRLLYEAQVEVIKKQIGDLELIRSSLGLSQRKMCQLLMVDPSAWTRWQKTDAPPHVYRALQWYLALNEKVPGLTPFYFLGKESSKSHSEIEQLKLANLELKSSIEKLQVHQKKMLYGLLALSFACVITTIQWLAS